MSKLGKPVRIVAPTIVRCTYISGTPNNRVAANIMDISLDELGTGRDAAVLSLVSQAITPWQDQIVNSYGPGLGFEGMHFTDLDSLDGTSGFVAPTSGHPTTGLDVNGLMSPNVSYLIHKNVAHGRSTRNGRTYLPTVAESKVDSAGVIDPTVRTAWTTHFGAYLSAVNTLSTGLGSTVAIRVVHVHKGDKTDPDTWTWSSSDINSFSCDNIVATQRRRLRA